MKFDRENTPKSDAPEPEGSNSHVQRLNLARQLAMQSDQHPGLATPEQNLNMSYEILGSLKKAFASGDISTADVLSALDQISQRTSAHLDSLESRLRTVELKRNQRRN